VIPIIIQPEPPSFNSKVRIKGINFLTKLGRKPYRKEWINHSYWREALGDLRIAYNGICAYSGTWIPYSVGNHSVDHFLPKDKFPNDAYEWNNFRYVSARFNSRKGTRKIVDPFSIQNGWFQLDLATFIVQPSPNITSAIQQEINRTIEVLNLNNDPLLLEERIAWYEQFRMGEVTLEHLHKKVPFLAREIERWIQEGLELP
jgi:hypothetical protein